MISHRHFLIREIRKTLEQGELTDQQRIALYKLLAPMLPFVPRPERTKKARAAKAVLGDNRPRWLEQ